MKPPMILSCLVLGSLMGVARTAVSTPDEQAAFLAGLPLSPESPLAPVQQGEGYRLHRKELAEKWGFCRKVRYDAMQKWGEEHLRKTKDQDVVRYLFGGPDFLNAFAFFPNAKTMVLGGLESVGEVPPPENVKPGNLSAALASLRQSLRTSLYCGYFITSEMGGQLHQGSFRGVLPVLYTELALTGNRIDSVSFEKPFGSPGVRITYHRPGHPEQTLYYFQANLANGQECRRFLAWLRELGPGATYLKAASYLLHGNEFSQVRDYLLGSSSLIVEDDSGIPYHCFAMGGWNVQLFGEYASPLPIFSGYAQKDFREAYKSPAYAGPVPFGAGYHVQPAHANILLATSVPGTLSLKDSPVAASDIKDREAAKAEAELLGSLRNSRQLVKPVALATPIPKPARVSADKAPGVIISRDRRSLASLEDEELKIRQDASLSKEERSVRLRDVWNRQLQAMGKAPTYRIPKADAPQKAPEGTLFSADSIPVTPPSPASAPIVAPSNAPSATPEPSPVPSAIPQAPQPTETTRSTAP